MPYDPQYHHRRSIRLPGYEYTQPGVYFVTLCTHERACCFGAVVDGMMQRNNLGSVVKSVWHALPRRFASVRLDAFVVMPNHLHGLVVPRKINRLRCAPGAPVWQRNYYEHIVRHEREWHAIRRYIAENPARWAEDELNH
jgi:REP element-mobilizing transposase RayT